jgi:hypothetical protein
VNKLELQFAEADCNKDGKISKQELVKFCRDQNVYLDDKEAKLIVRNYYYIYIILNI